MLALRVVTAVSVLCGGALAAQAPQPTERTKVREAIDRAYAAYIDAFARADAAALAAVYDERGARFNENGNVVRGREAIAADVKRFLDEVGPVKVKLEIVDLWVVDDRTYETGKWQYVFTPPGKGETTIGGRYVTVWKRQAGGDWRIEADMGIPGT